MSENSDNVCAEMYVSGRVQGVYFRGFTQKVATRLGLVGYAQNLPDGRVKVIAQGKRSLISELLDNLSIGPELSNVEGIDVDWIDASDEFTEFFIKR
ncbi:acylphosphatase [Methanococcoides vulcani]|uniref:Acylphosphatase n=1 Tax=Methanococcoides vulcani TaxID=1353158 RepID=A0A1H9YA09_9EURY|nr:acylphosphatase [Methanococcoides vulcani]SES65222.1 acylphosphatase [Methanococcoides vulcani]